MFFILFYVKYLGLLTDCIIDSVNHSRSDKNINDIKKDIHKCVILVKHDDISSPSLHILCHYPSFIEMYGDIINYCTMSFERHYKYIKNININNSKIH